jgi:ribonuclease III
MGPVGHRLLTAFSSWLSSVLGVKPSDLALYERALTHGSHGAETYERLEFLGDRILGLVIAQWLFERFPEDAEGQLSRRLNTLVSGETCAEIGRDIGVGPHLRLGKQARDDGASDSTNVLGDVVEALIGALYLDHGMDAAAAFVRAKWAPMIDGQRAAPRHPKSALQEWAAANGRKPPAYEILDRSGPHHAPRFTVRVTLGKAGSAEASGGSKQEAETAAAAALLDTLGA